MKHSKQRWLYWVLKCPKECNQTEFQTFKLMLKYFISREFALTLIGLIALGALVYLGIFFWFLPAYTRHGDSIVVPEVEELSEKEAFRVLEAADLRPVTVDSSYNSELPPGTVLSQYPRQHSFVKPDRTISLTINQKAAPQVNMPEIIDLSLYQAKARLESWKLRLGQVTRVPDVAENTILEARYEGKLIKSGTKLPEGAKIDVIVSDGKGSVSVAVPDLNGYSYSDALNLLRDLGLTLGGVYYNAGGPTDMNGQVYSQNPKPGPRDSVQIGSPIDIYVYGSEPEENEGILTEEIN